MPIDLAAMTLTPPAREHGSLAAAQLPFIAPDGRAALQDAATALGFTAVGTDQYSHPDGSWVAMNGQRVERGFKLQHFRGVPPAVTGFPVAQQGTYTNVAAAGIAPAPTATRWSAAQLADLTKLGFVSVLPNYFGVFADHSGSFAALRGSGGRNAAMIFSRRYSSLR